MKAVGYEKHDRFQKTERRPVKLEKRNAKLSLQREEWVRAYELSPRTMGSYCWILSKTVSL